MNKTKLTKIHFTNRDVFEKSHPIVCHDNTRRESFGDLDVSHADMIYTLGDEYMADRAIVRLREHGIEDFNVERNA